MSISNIQAYYYAWTLDHAYSAVDEGKIVGAISDTKIDLNPHQIEAALFAFNSPISKGAILADEVGLGKTIEAGILISQNWAERKRRLLIISPASLRTQWRDEIADKFGLPSFILERSTFDELSSSGIVNPFLSDKIVIVSYDFAKRQSVYIASIPWDLVVIDEAHKLRNVYKRTNVSARIIKSCLTPYKKLLLTATPLQNNLQELYGLVSIVDDDYFTNESNFSERYNAVSIRDNAQYGELRDRLENIIHRTLRRQVTEYVKYTNRKAITIEYSLNQQEIEIYSKLSEYLDCPYYIGISPIAKPLLSLLVRKIFSSSSFALSFTLNRILSRLNRFGIESQLDTHFDESQMSLEDSAIQLLQDDGIEQEESIMDEEKAALNNLITKISQTDTDSKAIALLKAIKIGFVEMDKAGAPRKALVFTESTRTQSYLKEILIEHGYQVCTFNGTNNDTSSNSIYSNWKINAPMSSQSGVSAVDKRKAIVDYFKNCAEIMIATEAGAEGINLQFCSLVINYDLPWNPQRVEQRIGRCHRYGQRFDVVVVNFVNSTNRADVRVFQLLNEKFKLFDGVLGASDELIGAIDGNFDIEKRIEAIYRACRTPEEIDYAFDQLQSDLEEVIKERINNSKKQLIESFDEDIVRRFNDVQASMEGAVDKRQDAFWQLILHVVGNYASQIVCDSKTIFIPENRNIPFSGWHSFSKNIGSPIRAFDGLGEYVINSAKSLSTFEKGLIFNLSDYRYKIFELNDFINRSGICYGYKIVFKTAIESFESFALCCFDEDGNSLSDEFGKKLMQLFCTEYNEVTVAEVADEILSSTVNRQADKLKSQYVQRYEAIINREIDKIEAYAQEVLTPLENIVIDLRKQLDSIKRSLRRASSASERLDLTIEKKSLEKKLKAKQKELFDLSDENDEETQRKLLNLRKSFDITIDKQPIFRFEWRIR